MNQELQRIKIAEALGWNRQSSDSFVFESALDGRQEHLDDLPDYLNDLNAMHEAEKTLVDSDNWDLCAYITQLYKITNGWSTIATAAQRAEAFLRTLNLWEE
jgi:hypothetical protein